MPSILSSKAGRAAGSALIALAALAVLLFSPAARAGIFNPETFTLANGLEVVVVTNRRAPVVLHMLWYKAGSADDPPGKSGIAHFLEHLMFKGTTSLKPGQFSKIVAENGGQENAITGGDFTAYYQNVAKDRLETVMRIEADRMANLDLPDDEVARERLVILEERRSRTENSPRSLLWEQLNAALFLHHPYRIPVIGWEHEMKGLTKADAFAFYRRWYGPNNAVLIVVGDVSAADVRPLAEKYYGVIARRAIEPRARLDEPPHRHARRVVYRDARVDQPQWMRRYIAPSYNRGESKHAHALQVLAEILGGGNTSRLYQSLAVQQNLAAGANAHYSPYHYDLGSFDLSASPRPGADLDALEKAIDSEITKIVEGGVSDEELARAKQVLGDRSVFASDNLRAGAMSFGVALTTGRAIDEVENWPERIARVTAAEVQAAARHVLKETGAATGILLGTGARGARNASATTPSVGTPPASPSVR